MTTKPPERFGADWALFLDVDGTLLDIAPEPDAVVVPPDILRALDRASVQLGGAVALISGRRIADLDRLFAPCRLAVAGQHGAELRAGRTRGNERSLAEEHGFAGRIEALRAAHPELLIEDKGRAVTFHYRRSPHLAGTAHGAAESIARDAPDRLHAVPGKMSVEIRERGVDKATALNLFMEAPPFAGRLPVFAGDDVTDEDGFRAARALGGHAIQIGPRRSAEAGWRVESPAAFRRWLIRAAGAEA